jgi:hypothetical protein
MFYDTQITGDVLPHVCNSPWLMHLTILYKLPYATAVGVHSSNPQSSMKDLVILTIFWRSHIWSKFRLHHIFPWLSVQNVQHEVLRYYAERSSHQVLVTKCKLTFLKCLNIESSINGFPPCQKIKNASLSDPKDTSQISTRMASFFLWVYHMTLFQTLALCFGVGMVKSPFITSHMFNSKSSSQQHIFQDTVQPSWYMSFYAHLSKWGTQ